MRHVSFPKLKKTLLRIQHMKYVNEHIEFQRTVFDASLQALMV